jgi:hypothetical protein
MQSSRPLCPQSRNEPRFGSSGRRVTGKDNEGVHGEELVLSFEF